LLAAAVVGLAGCGSGSDGSSDGKLKIVAGENFWGNLAQQVGGRYVEVTSLISNPDADPHLFAPGTSNGLAVATAKVVIVNGASYDPFMDKLLGAAPNSHRTVVRVDQVLHVTGSDPNPHLWYDAPRIPSVIEAITSALSTADPVHSAYYQRGATRTIRSLRPLEAAVVSIKQADAGEPVAYTERVPGYLLADAGLTVLTPPSFAQSIEDGIDPSFSDIGAMRSLITEHRIKALLVNEQAGSSVTKQLADLARSNNVPVVPVTETMPTGDTFQSWQLGQVEALTAALAS
jgi:zinc/manganese transport system substrate-binding protein